MDQVFLPYTFLESEMIMKTLLTFLTIALFSFGANADYNAKLSKDACQRYGYSALLQSDNLLRNADEGNVEDSKYWRKALVETATIYNAFCKD